MVNIGLVTDVVDLERRLVNFDSDPAVIVPLGSADPHHQPVDGKRDEPDHGDEKGNMCRVPIRDGTLHRRPDGSSADTSADETCEEGKGP